MNYPVEYTVIAENEKIYIEGGADYWGLFNYILGDYLRDWALGDMRGVLWNSASGTTFEPIKNWFDSFKTKGIVSTIGYIYGMYRVGETIDTYLNKKD